MAWIEIYFSGERQNVEFQSPNIKFIFLTQYSSKFAFSLIMHVMCVTNIRSGWSV